MRVRGFTSRLLRRRAGRRRHRGLGPVRPARGPVARAAARRAAGRPRSRPTSQACRARRWAERCDLAVEWVGQRLPRDQVRRRRVRRRHRRARWRRCARRSGRTCDLMVDLHWKFEAGRGDPPDPQARTLRPLLRRGPGASPRTSRARPAWRTASACRWRSARNGARSTSAGRGWSGARCRSIQPEMGHTGVTQFARIAAMAQAFHMR